MNNEKLLSLLCLVTQLGTSSIKASMYETVDTSSFEDIYRKSTSSIKLKCSFFESLSSNIEREIYHKFDTENITSTAKVKDLCKIFEVHNTSTPSEDRDKKKRPIKTIPTEEDVISLDEEFGFDLAKAIERQRYIRERGGDLNDIATHVVNLHNLIKNSYPKAVQNYWKAKKDLSEIASILKQRSLAPKELYSTSKKESKREYKNSRKKNNKKLSFKRKFPFKKKTSLSSSLVKILKEEEKNLTNKMAIRKMYNPDIIKEDIYEALGKIDLILGFTDQKDQIFQKINAFISLNLAQYEGTCHEPPS